MRIIKRYKEATLSDKDQQTIDLFKSGIDLYFDKKDFTKLASYQKRLKDMFGIDYAPYGDKKNIVPSLDTLYDIHDLGSLDRFDGYCYAMFDLRFSKYKGLYSSILEDKRISFERMKEVLVPRGYELEGYDDRRDTAIAQVKGKRVLVNFGHEEFNRDYTVYLGIFIHELGHVFEYEKNLVQKDLISQNKAMASSNYILNPSEVFAEHFKNYFLNFKFLKAGWGQVYDELDRLITRDWKELIKTIMTSAR